MWGRYCVIVYVVLFPNPLFFAFCRIPALYANFPAFYSKLFLYRLPPCIVMRAMHEWGGGGGVGFHGCCRSVRGFANEIILGRNLMCQPKAWCQVPVWVPVPQKTGESISAGRSGVFSRDRDFGLNVYPDLHMQMGSSIFLPRVNSKS